MGTNHEYQIGEEVLVSVRWLFAAYTGEPEQFLRGTYKGTRKTKASTRILVHCPSAYPDVLACDPGDVLPATTQAVEERSRRRKAKDREQYLGVYYSKAVNLCRTREAYESLPKRSRLLVDAHAAQSFQPDVKALLGKRGWRWSALSSMNIRQIAHLVAHAEQRILPPLLNVVA